LTHDTSWHCFSLSIYFNQQIERVSLDISSRNRSIFPGYSFPINESSRYNKCYSNYKCSPTLRPILLHPFGRSKVNILVSCVISLMKISFDINYFRFFWKILLKITTMIETISMANTIMTNPLYLSIVFSQLWLSWRSTPIVSWSIESAEWQYSLNLVEIA